MKYDYADPISGANARHWDEVLFCYGTHGETDIKKDLDCRLVKAYGAIGHRGAYDQAEYIFNAVEDWSEVQEIAGHSLGGAVALWLGLMTQKPVTTYGAFKVFWNFPKNHPFAVNFCYHSDLFFHLLWPVLRNYGITGRIKGKGFHPFTDHVRYEALKLYGIKYVKPPIGTSSSTKVANSLIKKNNSCAVREL